MSRKIIGITVGTPNRPITSGGNAEQVDNLIHLGNLNGCIVCNGEEITLNVGTDVKVGQVISFQYKKADGYTIGTFGTRMDTVNEPKVMEEGYADATFTIVEGYETCKFTGAYFAVIPQMDTYSKKEIDDMFGAYVNEVAELIGGNA